MRQHNGERERKRRRGKDLLLGFSNVGEILLGDEVPPLDVHPQFSL